MVPVPSRSSIYRTLIRHNLVDPQQRRKAFAQKLHSVCIARVENHVRKDSLPRSPSVGVGSTGRDELGGSADQGGP